MSVVESQEPEKTSQTITVSTPTGKTITSANFNLGASTTSGLVLSYVSSNINVATVSSDGLVTIIGVGSCDIIVSQSGNDTYLPAQVTVPFSVAYAVASNVVDTELLVYGDSIANNVGASSADKA